jgi:small subunit ribosomal protein S9
MGDDERRDEQAEPDEPGGEQEQQPEAEEQQPEAEEQQPEAEKVEEEQPEAEDQRPERTPEKAEPAGEVVPGAELDPIAIEPERELSAEERARLEAEAEERARLEAEATAEGEEPVARREPQVELPADARIQATGKRKSSIARVVLRAGSGGFQVNRRSLDEYFPRPYLQAVARQPLVTAGYEDAVDVQVRVHGGGVAGQAGAVRHGVARALTEIDPELRSELKRRGLLTRDARRKERRKAGLKKARKRPQFSKR